MRPVALLLLPILIASCVVAGPPATAPAEATGLSPADDVLSGLEKAGKDLKDLKATLRWKDIDTVGDLEATRIGTFAIDPVKQAFRLDLPRKQEGNKIYTDRRQEYVLKDGKLTERDYKNRKEIRRQVLKPGEKLNLLKLGEGPFPLPIGQNPSEVKAAFNVRRIDPAKDDPEGAVHLELIPKENSEYARRFLKMDVWVDTKASFPRRIAWEPNRDTRQVIDLTDLQLNKGLADADLEMSKADTSGWEVRDEAYGQ